MAGVHVDSVLEYDEPLPSTVTWTREKVYDNFLSRVKNYVISLFPIAQWIYRYNLIWLYGDLIAGITVGAVLVPQGMSYAQIATLPPEYGLYSSFVGVFIYCFFATSKDVSIGPVAVMSLQVSKVIEHVLNALPDYTEASAPLIAETLALLCGAIALGIGLLRLGFILEFIPIPAIMGFMTGSAINIVSGQVPGLFGIQKRFDTRAETYMVIINTLRNLGHTKLDAAFGLVCLFILYFSRWLFNFLTKRYPKYSRVFFFSSVLRNAVLIIFATLISWGVCKGYQDSGNYPISILKDVPRGFQHVGLMEYDRKVMNALTAELPVSVVVLLLEHIAISKSFGRINDYKINPNQELIAIGVTNLVGTNFSAYPATGSFSRSALKHKCGVRTPLAGIFTGIVVILALYALTDAFFWIPNAALCAVIIHAVGDLVSHPKTAYKFWKCSPVEAAIFIIAVILTVFITIEAGIYFAIAASLVLLLLRIAFPTGEALGKVEYYQVNSPLIHKKEASYSSIDQKKPDSNETTEPSPEASIEEQPSNDPDQIRQVMSKSSSQTLEPRTKSKLLLDNKWKRVKWVPLSHKAINPEILIKKPPPGVLVFRPGESFTYPNCSRQADKIVDLAHKETRRGVERGREIRLGDRPWNDNGPRHRKPEDQDHDDRPLLRAVVFDFSATPHVDLTGVQSLVDIKQALNKYANRQVEYHFVGILSDWVRRALVAEGFGGDINLPPERHYIQVALRDTRFAALAEGVLDDEVDQKRPEYKKTAYVDEEARDTESGVDENGEYVPIVGTNTPFFHFDIPDLEFDD
ncbi:hypothetical protein TRICI_003293 [Trichomonascus ciferrii]|uniref:STAS domain-containing protein n=1 Tax=Trichomonascus ciferrii TaxID=44093 RepID=A0A642VAG0_9ASCO|nr:hypothetical protein TRICI_003293 [Trichomonascus ciferrii]